MRNFRHKDIYFRKQVMRQFGFLLVEDHALMSTAAALEPLRAANLFSRIPLYGMRILSTGAPTVHSSVGSWFEACPMREAGVDFDLVFVVAGGEPQTLRDPALFTYLRQLDRAGVALGGISGGAAILANAGLLEGRRFTVHWHHFDAMKRMAPDLLIERRLFVIDRDRYTCAGGSAPLDMMHAIIARDHGVPFAQKISDWFIQTEIRGSEAPQQSGVAARYGPLPRAVEAAIGLMESHQADPLDLSQIAALSGLSARQLQRQFQAALGASVMETYRRLRLETARDLLRGSPLRIAEVAQMTGFATQAHFAETYAQVHGHPPSRDRGQDQGRDQAQAV